MQINNNSLWQRVCHLVQARRHDEEGGRGLMSSRRSRGRQVVALENILVLRLALVEVVVLSSDCGHLEHVAQHLSSCMRQNRPQSISLNNR